MQSNLPLRNSSTKHSHGQSGTRASLIIVRSLIRTENTTPLRKQLYPPPCSWHAMEPRSNSDRMVPGCGKSSSVCMREIRIPYTGSVRDFGSILGQLHLSDRYCCSNA